MSAKHKPGRGGGTKLDKAYLKRVGIYIGATLAALTVAFLIGYHLWVNMTSEIETVPAVPDTFSVTAEYDAFVFRDEISLGSDAAGTVVPAVKNGEKVGKTDLVASVYSSVPADTLSELSSIRSQIRLLEGKRSSTVSGDLGIGDVMVSLSSALKNGNLSSAPDFSARLTALVSARANGRGDPAELIKSLEDKESAVLSSLGTPISSVYTPYSGWYYGDSDGLESVFTPETAVDITPEKLDSLISSSTSEKSASGRIVKSHTWYLAVNMSKSDGGSFYVGRRCEVTVPGISEPIPLKVVSAVSGSDGRIAVVFSCEKVPEGVSVDRHLTLDFTLREVTGFGIPKEAVRIFDGQTGVFTFNGVTVKFKKINILEELDDVYIAEIHKDKVTPAPETAEGTGEVTSAVTTEPDPVGNGTGRKDYLWLEVNEFIVVKGKALQSGKVIG